MQINSWPRKDRSGTLFELCFQSTEEREAFVSGIERECGNGKEFPGNLLLEAAGKIRGRCDGRFARDGVACSARLFQKEMAEFALALVYRLIESMPGTNEQLIEAKDQHIGILERHIEEQSQHIKILNEEQDQCIGILERHIEEQGQLIEKQKQLIEAHERAIETQN